ncbi:MAG: DNA integrity scanning protein DisA [Coriobacteriales bacterium]|nr:DNA integrity scanning protein DisA [Coriobacteriales bacterium]
MREQFSKVAPGTQLREGLDMILAGRTGALITIGDEADVRPLTTGGFKIDAPFTPQRLFELAKMDGAIILDSAVTRIIRANVHLIPDPTLPTSETGMRHRTAERVSRQTKALVISVSQRREVVSLYLAGRRVTLQETNVILAKADQALQTLQRYRQRLDQVLDRLTLLEFDDLATVGDVSEVIMRFEMLRRVASEVRRYILQLGTEGRLVAMQADELVAGVEEQYQLFLRDYAADPGARRCAALRRRLSELPLESLLETDRIADALGLSSAQQAEEHLRPRGYRVLTKIPMLPTSVVGRIVDRFGTLTQVIRASADDLDEVDGVGSRRALAIIGGLARLRAHLAI